MERSEDALFQSKLTAVPSIYFFAQQYRFYPFICIDVLQVRDYTAYIKIGILRAQFPIARTVAISLRILIADDHEVVRRGVCSVLESYPDYKVCGEATNGDEAVKLAAKLHPDFIVLDVSMPMLDGFSAAKKIKEASPETPILMLSMHAGREMVRASQAAGAQGFVTKTDVAAVLLTAVEALRQGKTFFTDNNF
jgi:CheY-like chemotaxis protein